MGVEVGGGAVNLKKRTLKFQERGSVAAEDCRPGCTHQRPLRRMQALKIDNSASAIGPK